MDRHRLLSTCLRESPVSSKVSVSSIGIPRGNLIICLGAIALLCGGCATLQKLFDPSTPGQRHGRELARIERSSTIDEWLEVQVRAILADPARISQMRGMEVGVALASLGRREANLPTPAPLMGTYHGDRRAHAGTMVALVYAAYYFAHMERAPWGTDPIVRRNVAQMLGEGSATAISFVLDAITDTESGPPLEGPAFEQFRARRYQVNDYLSELGLHPPMRAGQKVWETAPYGRDFQLLGAAYTNENVVTADGLARLMVLVERGVLGRRREGDAMMKMLIRDRDRTDAAPVRGRVVTAYPTGVLAALASRGDHHYHEAAIIHDPAGNAYVLAITTNRPQAGADFTVELTQRMHQAIEQRRLPIPRPAVLP